MKFFTNFKLRVSLVLVTLIAFTACEDADKRPIVTFDDAAHGIYIREVETSGDLLINLLTESSFQSSPYSYTVEFVDDNQSANVAEYIAELTYVPGTGDPIGPVQIVSVPASSMTRGESGFLQTSVSIGSTELAALVSLGYTDFTPGDQFRIEGTVVHNDGTRFDSGNSSSSVTGVAFQALFNIIRPLACPSALEGTFSYTTTDVWCDGSTVSGEVTIEANGGGNYGFDDWSFGAYDQCYGGGVAGWGELEFNDLCEVLTFPGVTDNYGDTWTFDTSVSGTEWTINWTNTFGESGNTTITNPDGWQFTIPD